MPVQESNPSTKRLKTAYASPRELKITEASLTLDHELFGTSLLLRISKGLSSDHVTLSRNPRTVMQACLPSFLPFSDAFDDHFDTRSQLETEKFFYNTIVKTVRRLGKETHPKDYTRDERDLADVWNMLEQNPQFPKPILSTIFNYFNITVVRLNEENPKTDFA